MLPESAELVLFAAFVLAFAFVFAPAAAPRRSLLLRGGAGLAGTITIVAVPTFELVLLTLLTLGVLNAAADGKQPFAVRLKAPVFAVAVFALGLVLARAAGPEVLDRFAAVGLVAGVAAGIGLLPYLHPFDPDDAATGSPIAWMAFIGPALAVVVAGTRGLVPAEAGGGVGAMLIGVGLLNVAWGGVAAWLTESPVAARRYSFLADWGPAFCGFGLMVVDGRRAALLVLFSIVLCRLPLYLASPQSLRAKTVTERPVNPVVAAALAGATPFPGPPTPAPPRRRPTQPPIPPGLELPLGMLLGLPRSW